MKYARNVTKMIYEAVVCLEPVVLQWRAAQALDYSSLPALLRVNRLTVNQTSAATPFP